MAETHHAIHVSDGCWTSVSPSAHGRMISRKHVSAIVALVCVTAPSVAAQEVGVRLDSVMHVAEHAGFSGVVRIEKDGVILLEKGYGLADRAKTTLFTPATIVQIGSNTKDFTAVAILQLKQAGRLALTDSLGKYFPDVPADKRSITIRQLMNHRAGFPLGIGGDFEVLDRKAFLDRAMGTPLLFAPGARESYSNTGYSVLAAIIEQLTGKAYDMYVRDAILAPIGLAHTGFLLPDFKTADLAHGYQPNGNDQGTMLGKPHAADGPYWNLRGNGGMLSTVGEMHAFYHALFETDKLMSPATRALRFNPDEPIGLAGSDGVNFFLYDRFPPARTEVIIASTNAASKAPAVRRELGGILGLPDPGGDGDDNVVRRPGGKPTSPAVSSELTSFVQVLNAGDVPALRKFISDHFASEAGGPTLGERLQRFTGAHDNLGLLTIVRLESFDDGSVEVTLNTAAQGLAVMRVNVDSSAPYLIHGIQIRIGG
jgi:CubicO group peptidase (beta-lactamase class C family)